MESIMIPLPEDPKLIFWCIFFRCFSYKYIFKTWDHTNACTVDPGTMQGLGTDPDAVESPHITLDSPKT